MARRFIQTVSALALGGLVLAAAPARAPAPAPERGVAVLGFVWIESEDDDEDEPRPIEFKYTGGREVGAFRLCPFTFRLWAARGGWALASASRPAQTSVGTGTLPKD